jgi:hypothetical protein
MQQQDFNVNTSFAQAHRELVDDLWKAFNHANHVLGKPQLIRLPFKCELRLRQNECLLFDGDPDVINEISTPQAQLPQFHTVLTVSLNSIEESTDMRNTGGLRVVGSPILAAHIRAAQQQQQPPRNGTGRNGNP